MKTLPTLKKYICIATNKYGTASKVFTANRYASSREDEVTICKALGLWMYEDDQIQIDSLEDNGDVFILDN